MLKLGRRAILAHILYNRSEILLSTKQKNSTNLTIPNQRLLIRITMILLSCAILGTCHDVMCIQFGQNQRSALLISTISANSKNAYEQTSRSLELDS